MINFRTLRNVYSIRFSPLSRQMAALMLLLLIASVSMAQTCDPTSNPCINQLKVGDKKIKGKLKSPVTRTTTASIQIQHSAVPPAPVPALVPVGSPAWKPDGTFTMDLDDALVQGDTVTITQTPGGAGTASALPSTCDKSNPKPPCIDQPYGGDKQITGKTSPGAAIDVKVNSNSVGPATVNSDGAFSKPNLQPLSPYDNVEAEQTLAGVKSGTGDVPVLAKAADHGTSVVLIGGWEQSGYSSLGQSGNPFLNVFIRGSTDSHRLTGWGRVRLLGVPQPATQGIVSTFTDPTGQITTLDYSKVGQAMDFVVGPEYKLARYWSLIAGFGATTPLSSQSVTLTYQVPAPGTVECTTLVTRFSAQKGYNPGLILDPTGKTCLQGGYADIAFSNQDRSSFLRKYGAGFRTSYPFPCKSAGTDSTNACATSYAALDLTFGQDESVTGGQLRRVVFKMDGILPIPTGNAAWLYLFGSAYIRMAHNESFSPLILQTATGVTIPSPSVIVLPLRQPNRDYYRLGVGLNLNQIFCKISGSSCPSKTTTSGNPAAPATK